MSTPTLTHNHNGHVVTAPEPDVLAGMTAEQIARMAEIVAESNKRAADARKAETQARARDAAQRIKAAATKGIATTGRVGATTGIVAGKGILGLWKGVFTAAANLPDVIGATVILGMETAEQNIKDTYAALAPASEGGPGPAPDSAEETQ